MKKTNAPSWNQGREDRMQAASFFAQAAIAVKELPSISFLFRANCHLQAIQEGRSGPVTGCGHYRAL